MAPYVVDRITRTRLPDVWAWVARVWLTMVAGWTVRVEVVQRRRRAVWRAVRGMESHHGTVLLLTGESSLRGQTRVARALGGMDRALIVQKLHEWIEYNKQHGGAACTYNGYSEWVADHFGWLSEAALGRHVRALEALGVLVTTQAGKRDRRKTYRINYRTLNALVKAGAPEDTNVKHGDIQVKVEDAKVKHRRTKAKADDTKTHDVPMSNQTITNGLPMENQPEPAAPVVVDPVCDDLRRLGISDEAAAAMVGEHGADRVRAVAAECQRRGSEIRNRTGWVLAELKRDVFGLGCLAAGDRADRLTIVNTYAPIESAPADGATDYGWAWKLIETQVQGVREYRTGVDVVADGAGVRLVARSEMAAAWLARSQHTLVKRLGDVLGMTVTIGSEVAA